MKSFLVELFLSQNEKFTILVRNISLSSGKNNPNNLMKMNPISSITFFYKNKVLYFEESGNYRRFWKISSTFSFYFRIRAFLWIFLKQLLFFLNKRGWYKINIFFKFLLPLFIYFCKIIIRNKSGIFAKTFSKSSKMFLISFLKIAKGKVVSRSQHRQERVHCRARKRSQFLKATLTKSDW